MVNSIAGKQSDGTFLVQVIPLCSEHSFRFQREIINSGREGPVEPDKDVYFCSKCLFTVERSR